MLTIGEPLNLSRAMCIVDEGARQDRLRTSRLFYSNQCKRLNFLRIRESFGADSSSFEIIREPVRMYEKLETQSYLYSALDNSVEEIVIRVWNRNFVTHKQGSIYSYTSNSEVNWNFLSAGRTLY